MNKQVLSIEQMQHLKELGVDTINASMCWRRKTRDWKGETKVGRWGLTFNHPIIVSNFETYEDVTTFTLQDILDLLPKEIINGEYKCLLTIIYNTYNNKWIVSYEDFDFSVSDFRYENLLDSLYEMLCWCIENGYIETNKKE